MKVGEEGITVVIGTTYDLSSHTALEVTLINPSGEISTIADGDISTSASDYSSTYGTFSGNTYAMFDTETTTFDVSGDWTGYLKYTASGKTLYGNTFTITVEAVP